MTAKASRVTIPLWLPLLACGIFCVLVLYLEDGG
jgi:hypothetical protein